MSLLHQEPGEEVDDAARGEAFTKGTSHVIWAGVLAAVTVTVAIAVYVMAGEKPPVASGEVVQVWAQPRHIQTTGFDANGDAMAQESFDQVLVLARVKLHNQSRYPLFLQDVLANIERPNGTLSVSAGSAGQYEEALVAYPELAALHAPPLSPRTTIAPGETVEGTAFWAVRMTRQAWETRQGLNLRFNFQYQSSLVLEPHAPVTELQPEPARSSARKDNR
jgi:hypothetical protein